MRDVFDQGFALQRKSEDLWKINNSTKHSVVRNGSHVKSSTKNIKAKFTRPDYDIRHYYLLADGEPEKRLKITAGRGLCLGLII